MFFINYLAYMKLENYSHKTNNFLERQIINLHELKLFWKFF